MAEVAPPAAGAADGTVGVSGASSYVSQAGEAGSAVLMLGALGIVYGDIGTSPLYSVQTVFSLDGGAVRPTPVDVFGIVSLIFWSITLIVSVKYVAFVLRASNDGEGGVMALAALARRVLVGATPRRLALVMALGVLGASLFYGDSVITPAISVLSAVEGMEVVSRSLADAVVPVAAVILEVLFRPGILAGLSPTYAAAFFAEHPGIAFIAMGAVVLAITGAEALYADLGHFGASPIRRAWFLIVFPALTLNYLGQGALILRDPAARDNPFYLLVPHWARIPMIVLATAATVIASQAVISGAYSVSRQALRLGFLPRLRVRHTSAQHEGQVYVPSINWGLLAAVLVLVFTFRSSTRLASAYGVAVTGTFLITTALFLLVARTLWHWPAWRLCLVGAAFGLVELTFFGANILKVREGGWLTLLIAAIVFTVMLTWQRGREIVTARRTEMEGPVRAFIDDVHAAGVTRVPGTAVFPHPSKETTPLALRANLQHNHVLHERVVIISGRTANLPHIPWPKRLTIDPLGDPSDGIVHIDAEFGFQDRTDFPEVLKRASAHPTGALGGPVDPDTASYFVSRITLRRSERPGMSTWRKALFIGLAHNAASQAEFLCLPDDRTVVMGSHVEL